MMPNVFISYAREDSPVAHRLSEMLAADGQNVFLDETTIVSGESFTRSIERALGDAKVIVVLLSKNSNRSKWVEAELRSALQTEKVVIPVLLDEEATNNWVWPLVSDRNAVKLESPKQMEEVVRLVNRAIGYVDMPPKTLSAPSIMATTSKEIISIFLSHRAEDKETVKEFETVLSSRARGKLKFFIAEAMLAETDWFQKIKNDLRSADLLFLVYTVPHADWDWCLYEVGLFEGLKLTSKATGENTKRIVVFYSPGTNLPPQLEFVEAVCADREGIAQFLRDFFGTTYITDLDEPINPDFAKYDAAVHADAERISVFFERGDLR